MADDSGFDAYAAIRAARESRYDDLAYILDTGDPYDIAAALAGVIRGILGTLPEHFGDQFLAEMHRELLRRAA